MRIPDPKANTTTEAYLAYKAGYLEENELKPVLYEPYLHFDGWLAYWAGLTDTYPNKGPGKNQMPQATVNMTDSGDRQSQFYMSLPAGTYTISFDLDNIENGTGSSFSIYMEIMGAGGTQVAGVYLISINSSTTPGRKYKTFTISGDGTTDSKDNIRIPLGDWNKGARAMLSNIQIEAGSTATEYEPYTIVPEMLTDEEALVAYLSGVTDTYPQEIKDPYDVRIVGYLKHLASVRWPEPDYPVNNEEFYLSTMEPTHTSNPTPSADIELDTSEGKLIDVKAYGDTYQQTYSGKNLFNYQGVVNLAIGTTIVEKSTYRGYYIQANAGDTFTLSRATTTGNNRLRVGFTMVEPARGVEVYDEDGVVEGYISADNATEVSFTVPQDMHYVFIYLSNSDQDITESLKIQLETGSTATAYEPYVGGIPSPNPDYPQDVNVVTGEQTVKVNGKNLSPSLDEYTWQAYHASNLSVTSTSVSCKTSTRSTSSGVYIARANLSTVCPALAQTGSVVSCSVNLSVASHIKCGFEGGVTGTYVSIDVPAGNTNISFITKTTGNLSFCVENKTGATMTISNLQVESGSTATEFSPYAQLHTVNLGSIELCKIDDYQDYIYRDGDDWYVHKATGKSMLGGLDWSPTAGRGSTAYRMVSTDLKGLFVPPLDNQRYLIGYCSHFKMETAEGTYYYRTGISGSPNGNRIYIWHPDYNKDTTESSTGFKTWLTNNNVVFYYPLVTPTDTKITDSSLVEQLDALMEGGSYEGKTYIKVTATDPNLPGLLYVEAYKY